MLVLGAHCERNCSLASVEGIKHQQLFRSQLKIKDQDVVLDALRVRRLWNWNGSVVDEIAQYHLPGRLVVLLSNRNDTLVHERWLDFRLVLVEVMRTSQWTISSDGDVTSLAEFNQLLLIDAWRALDLVGDRLDSAIIQNASDLLAVEVADANRFHQSQINQLLHRLPSVQVIDIRKDQVIILVLGHQVFRLAILEAKRCVHQIQINVIQVQVLQALAAGLFDTSRIMKNIPQFSRNENFFPLQLAGCNFLIDCFSNLLFILVEVGSIDVTIATFQGQFCRCVSVIFSRLKIEIEMSSDL